MTTREPTKADMANAIAHCRIHSPHTVPLLEAACHGVITLAAMPRTHSVPFKVLERAALPSIVLISDDMADGSDTGPEGWRCLPRLLRWARRAVIHGAGGRVDDYRGFVMLAVQCRRMALIETNTAGFMAWHTRFAQAGTPTVNLVPSDGVHPVAPAREKLH